jgi:hypothetical protein
MVRVHGKPDHIVGNFGCGANVVGVNEDGLIWWALVNCTNMGILHFDLGRAAQGGGQLLSKYHETGRWYNMIYETVAGNGGPEVYAPAQTFSNKTPP